MKKKAVPVLLSLTLLAACCTGCGTSDDPVSVESVAMITGAGSVGLYDRYGGIVEAGETVKVQKDDNMQVKEIKVEAGDTVTKGQTLFSYDTETLSLELEKQQLELEQLQNTITTKKNQIQTLEKEKQSAAASEQLEYTIQIQQLQIDVKEAEYNVTAKQQEIDRSKSTLANATVVSPVDGRIQSIATDSSQQPSSGYYDGTSDPQAFITITQSGDYRVKGVINEQNAGSMTEGLSVIIRSRTDETVTWRGTVTGTDWENPVTNTNNYYYSMDASDEMTASNKYPFYIDLETDDNLMLGQHVYIEPDLGQDAQTALCLPSYYINDADTDPWVWAANDKDKLEKRSLTLGAYDENLMTYEVLEGLTLEDYIAFPDETLKEGQEVIYYDDSSFDGGEPANGMEELPMDETLPEDDFSGVLDTDASSEEALPAADDGVWPDDSIDPVTGMAPETEEGAVG